MPNFLCPNCNEEATYFHYSARTSGYESGTAEWDDTTDDVLDLALNTEDSESDGIDNITYECPNCNEEINTDQIQEFLNSRGVVHMQRQHAPHVRATMRHPFGEPGFKFLSMQGNETLDDNNPRDSQTTTLPLGANQMGMCDRCGRAYISNSSEDECPHCS